MDKSKIKFHLFINILMVMSVVPVSNSKLIPGDHNIIKANGTVRTESKFYVVPNAYSANDNKHDETLKKIIDDMSNTTGYVKKTYKFVFGKRKSSIRNNENQTFIDLTRKIGKDTNHNRITHMFLSEMHGKQKNDAIRDTKLSQNELFSYSTTDADGDMSSQYDNSKNIDSVYQSNLNAYEYDRHTKKIDKYYSGKESQLTLNYQNKSIEIHANNDNLNHSNHNDGGRYVIHSKTNKYTNTNEDQVNNEIQKESSNDLIVDKSKINNTYQKIYSNKIIFDKENENDDNLGPIEIGLNNANNFDVKNEHLEIKYNDYANNGISVSDIITGQNKLKRRRNYKLKVIPLQEEMNNHRFEEISSEKYGIQANERKINDVVVISDSPSTSSIPETYVLTKKISEKTPYRNSIGELPIIQNFPDNLDETYNTDDKIKVNVLLNGGNPPEDQIDAISNMIKSSHIDLMKNIDKTIHACISKHCNDTDIKYDYNQNEPDYLTFVTKICEAARQNVIDFWKIIAKYLGLEMGQKEDLLEAEKLYVILTVFTQLRRAIEFGYPIEKTVDAIVKLLQPSVFHTQESSVLDPKIKSNETDILEFEENNKVKHDYNFNEVHGYERGYVMLNRRYKPSKTKDTLDHKYLNEYPILSDESHNDEVSYGDTSVVQVIQTNIPQKSTPVQIKPIDQKVKDLAPEIVATPAMNNQEPDSINEMGDLHMAQQDEQDTVKVNIPLDYDDTDYIEKYIPSDDDYYVIPQHMKWNEKVSDIDDNDLYKAVEKLWPNKNVYNPKSHTWHEMSASHTKYKEKPKAIDISIHDQPMTKTKINVYQSIANDLKANVGTKLYPITSTLLKKPMIPHYDNLDSDNDSVKNLIKTPLDNFMPVPKSEISLSHIHSIQNHFYPNKFKDSTYVNDSNSVGNNDIPISIENYFEVNNRDINYLQDPYSGYSGTNMIRNKWIDTNYTPKVSAEYPQLDNIRNKWIHTSYTPKFSAEYPQLDNIRNKWIHSSNTPKVSAEYPKLDNIRNKLIHPSYTPIVSAEYPQLDNIRNKWIHSSNTPKFSAEYPKLDNIRNKWIHPSYTPKFSAEYPKSDNIRNKGIHTSNTPKVSAEYPKLDNIRNKWIHSSNTPKVSAKYPKLDNIRNKWIHPSYTPKFSAEYPQLDNIRNKWIHPSYTLKVSAEYPQLDNIRNKWIHSSNTPKFSAEYPKLDNIRNKWIHPSYTPKFSAEYPQLDNIRNKWIHPSYTLKVSAEYPPLDNIRNKWIHSSNTPKVSAEYPKLDNIRNKWIHPSYTPKFSAEYPQLDNIRNKWIHPSYTPKFSAEYPQLDDIRNKWIHPSYTLKVSAEYPPLDNIRNKWIHTSYTPIVSVKYPKLDSIRNKWIDTSNTPNVSAEYPQLDNIRNKWIHTNYTPTVSAEYPQLDNIPNKWIHTSYTPKVSADYPQLDNIRNKWIDTSYTPKVSAEYPQLDNKEKQLRDIKLKKKENKELKKGMHSVPIEKISGLGKKLDNDKYPEKSKANGNKHELLREIIINLKQYYVPDYVVNDVMQKINKIIPKAKESSECKKE